MSGTTWSDVLGQYRSSTSHPAIIARLEQGGLTPADLESALGSPLPVLSADPAVTTDDLVKQVLLVGEVAEFFAACSDAAAAVRGRHVAKLVELTCVNEAAAALSLSQGYVSRLYRRRHDPRRPALSSLQRLLRVSLSPAPTPCPKDGLS